MAQSTAPQNPTEHTASIPNDLNQPATSHYEIEEDSAKPLKGILLKPGEQPHHKDQELKIDKTIPVKDVFTPNSKYEDHKVEGKRGLVQRKKSGTRLMPKPPPDEDEDEEDEEKQQTAEINSKINKEVSSEPPLPIFTNPQALAAPTQVLLDQSAEAASTPTTPVAEEKEAKKRGGLRGMVRKGLGKGSGNKGEEKDGKEKKDDKDKKEEKEKKSSAKDSKEGKEGKDGKDNKEAKEGKETTRDTSRESKEVTRVTDGDKEGKESKEGKEKDKENKDKDDDKEAKAKAKAKQEA